MLHFRASGFVVACLLLCAIAPPSARGEPPAELWVVVHAENPVAHLDAEALFQIFALHERFWPDRTPIVALNAPSRSPLRSRFDRAVLNMSPQEVGRFWIDQRVRGAGTPPRKVPRPDIAVRVVQRLRGAITYVPAGMCLKGTKAIAIIAQDGTVVGPPSEQETSKCKPRL